MSDTYNIGPTVPGLFAAHESRFKEAADEIDRLRATLENLLKYAWHKPGCEKCCVPIGYHSCTCGYDALMRKWRKNQILCVANPTTDQATASDAGGNEMNTGCLRCGRLPGNSHTEICALQGEIERLRHDIKRHIAIASDLATEIERLRAELAKADGQINRCVEQNKYLESTISRPQDQIALTPKPFCEEHSKFPYEECPWCEAEAQTALVSRLREYAWHKASCSRFPDLPFDCDCGYDELMKELEESK